VKQTASERLADALLPLLRDAMGGVEVRRGYGAIGLYLQDTLFGLIQDGVVLFRVDARTHAAYDAANGETAEDDDPGCAFDPPGGGAMAVAGFRRLPHFVLNDEDTLADWGKDAWEAAKRSRATSTVA